MSELNDDIAKYRKKRDPDISKAVKKSKHKHLYEPCLIELNNRVDILNGHLCGSSYCTICGKIGGSMLGYDAVKSGKYWRSLTREEILEKYKGYPLFITEDLFQGYVGIGKELNEKIDDETNN